MKSIIYISICLTFCGGLAELNCLVGQTTIASGNMVAIEQEGFYHLKVDSSLLAFAKPDLSNIRVLDEQGVEVPYIIRQSEQKTEEVFIPWLDFALDYRDQQTAIHIRNREGEEWQNVCLRITPAQTTKYASLSGSRDGSHWFVVRDQLRLNPDSREDAYEIRPIYFAGLNYPFLKMVINDSLNPPLEILGLGRYETKLVTKKAWEQLPAPKIESLQSSRDNQSLFLLTWNYQYPISRMTFDWEGATLYDRMAEAYMLEKRSRKRRRKHITYDYRKDIASFHISSKKMGEMSNRTCYTDSLYIEVMNGDSPALTMASAHAYANSKNLILWLGQGEYKLQVLTESYPPDYDLTAFQGDIPNDISEWKPQGELTLIDTKSTKKNGRSPYVYLFLAASMLLVIGVVVKMLSSTSLDDKALE